MKCIKICFLFIILSMVGCESLPPKENAISPSTSLADVLGTTVEAVAIFGGVGWYESKSPRDVLSGPMAFPSGALIVAREGLYFRAWLGDKRHYAKGGLEIPYSKIVGVFSDPLRLVVIEQLEEGSTGSIAYNYFLFPLATRNGSPSLAEQTLVSLIDRSADKHLTTEDMRRHRDRVVAVVRGGNPVKVLVKGEGAHEVGLKGRAKKGAEIGGTPAVLLGQLGGGIAALPVAILGGALGAAIGGIVGAVEQLTAPPRSEYEKVVKTKKELDTQTQDMTIQTWLQEAVLEKLDKQSAPGPSKETTPLFARVDDIVPSSLGRGVEVYLSLFRERIDHVLEVSVHSVLFELADKKEKMAAAQVKLEVEAGYRVLRIPSGKKLAEENFRCVTSSHPLDLWQSEGARLLQVELRNCVNNLGDSITKDFVSRFPNTTSLHEANR